MNFRVTPSLVTSVTARQLSNQTAELYRAQQQVSSGLRVQTASDDPVAMRRSLVQQDAIDRLGTRIESISHARSRLTQAHTYLLDAQQLLVKARENALSGRQTSEPAEAKALASELDSLMVQMRDISNASDTVGPLFAGTGVLRPFEGEIAVGGVSLYSGTSDATQLYEAGGVPRESLRPGNTIFQPHDRGETLIFGSTGVTTGTEIDSATGRRSLIVSHTATTYSAGSGIQTGTSSAAGDTVIGATGLHSIEIIDTSGTGSFGTVSLNGGPPVAFTNADVNLNVTGPSGEQVFVDTTAVTAGFSGSVDLTADGTLSLDGGLTTTVIDFSVSQQVVDSRNGEVVYLNTTATKATGTNQLEFPGTSDIFQTLRQLRDDLLMYSKVDNGEYTAAIGRRLDDIDRQQTHLLDEIGLQSVALEHLDQLENRATDIKLSETIEHGETISADIAAAALDLQRAQSLQEFTMATVGQLLSTNLLDYLR